MDIDPAVASALRRPAYPRSGSYDPAWMLENWMGPNALWLMEGLVETIQIQPKMRVLDLGCGRAISSIFLAKEYDVDVVAADLWIDPSENWDRIKEAGVQGRVMPLRAEAHDLPFAAGYFDAIVSVDAYQYFGTDELYLRTLAAYLRPGGRIGIVVPGLTEELDDGPPSWLEPLWDPQLFVFHSPGWWQRLWERSGVVQDVRAELVPEGAQDWLLWADICVDLGVGVPNGPDSEWEAKMLRADEGRTLAFARVTASA